MAGRVQWNDRAADDFLADASTEAVRIVTEKVARDGKSLMPVASAARPRPGHTARNPEGGSWPPGSMRRSVGTRYGTNVFGKPVGIVAAAWQYQFHAKKVHGLRPALTMALARQRGSEVP